MDGSSGTGPRWFDQDEVRGLDPKLVEMLDRARGLSHVPFRITSALRSSDQNDQVGGVMNSSHTRGLAVDLGCFDSRSRMKIVSALIIAGFRRIGVYSAHLHTDIDDSLPQDVMWFGGESR